MFTWKLQDGERFIVFQQVTSVTIETSIDPDFFFVQIVGTDTPVSVPREEYDRFKKELAAYLSRKNETTEKILDSLRSLRSAAW